MANKIFLKNTRRPPDIAKGGGEKELEKVPKVFNPNVTLLPHQGSSRGGDEPEWGKSVLPRDSHRRRETGQRK